MSRRLSAKTQAEDALRAARISDNRNRPDDVELGKILGAIQTGANLTYAATLVGRSPQWLSALVRNNPDIAELVEEARDWRRGAVLRANFENALVPGKAGVADRIFFLKNECGWGDRSVISASIGVGFGSLTELTEASMNPERVSRVREELAEEKARILADPKTIDIPSNAEEVKRIASTAGASGEWSS